MKKTILTVALLALVVLPVVKAQRITPPVPRDGLFDLCLQDDTDPTTLVQFSDQTGQYSYFCAGAPAASGTGALIRFGTMGWLAHQKGTRIVYVMWDTAGAGTGSAYITHSGVASCWINDSNMSNNTCVP